MIAVTLAIIKKLAISRDAGDGAVTALTMPVSRAAKVSATSASQRFTSRRHREVSFIKGFFSKSIDITSVHRSVTSKGQLLP